MDTEMPTQEETTVESPRDSGYQQARNRAEMIQGLYIHLLVYAVFNAGLFALNWVTRGDSGSWWFQWPLVIWGVGLVVHVLATIAPVFSPEWADRRARQDLSNRDR
jgi:2TM domain